MLTGANAGRRYLSALPYVAVLAVAAFFLYLTSRIGFSAPRGRIGPNFWPRAVLGLMILVCVYEIAKRILFGRADAVVGVAQALLRAAGEDDEAGRARGSLWRLLGGVAATLAYVLLVDVFGFFLSTFAFIAAFIVLGGYGRWCVALMAAGIGSLVLVVIFMKIVYVSLPLGAGPFRAVSVALMGVLGIR